MHQYILKNETVWLVRHSTEFRFFPPLGSYSNKQQQLRHLLHTIHDSCRAQIEREAKSLCMYVRTLSIICAAGFGKLDPKAVSFSFLVIAF